MTNSRDSTSLKAALRSLGFTALGYLPVLLAAALIVYATVAGGYFVALAGFALIYAIFCHRPEYSSWDIRPGLIRPERLCGDRRLHIRVLTTAYNCAPLLALVAAMAARWYAPCSSAIRRCGSRAITLPWRPRARTHRLRDLRPMAVGHPRLHGHLRHPAARHRRLRGDQRSRAASPACWCSCVALCMARPG